MSDNHAKLIMAVGALLARLGGSVELTRDELAAVVGSHVYMEFKGEDDVVLGLERGNLQ